MQRRSSTSAGAIYLDREARLRAIEAMARRASERLPEIRRVVLFGSMVDGIPTMRSDADLLVEVTHTEFQRPADRAAVVLSAMEPLACAVDLFVVTTDEMSRPPSEQSPLVKRALAGGVDLLGDGGSDDSSSRGK